MSWFGNLINNLFGGGNKSTPSTSNRPNYGRFASDIDRDFNRPDQEALRRQREEEEARRRQEQERKRAEAEARRLEEAKRQQEAAKKALANPSNFQTNWTKAQTPVFDQRINPNLRPPANPINRPQPTQQVIQKAQNDARVLANADSKQVADLSGLIEQKKRQKVEEEKKKLNWFDRNLFDTGWKKRAEDLAVNSAVNEYYNRQNPTGDIRYSDYAKNLVKNVADSRGVASKDTAERTKRFVDNVDNVDNAMRKAYNVLQFLPGVSLGAETVGGLISKVAGEESEFSQRQKELTQDREVTDLYDNMNALARQTLGDSFKKPNGNYDWNRVRQELENAAKTRGLNQVEEAMLAMVKERDLGNTVQNVSMVTGLLDLIPIPGAGAKVPLKLTKAGLKVSTKPLAKAAAVKTLGGAATGAVIAPAATAGILAASGNADQMKDFAVKDWLKIAGQGAKTGFVGGLVGGTDDALITSSLYSHAADNIQTSLKKVTDADFITNEAKKVDVDDLLRQKQNAFNPNEVEPGVIKKNAEVEPDIIKKSPEIELPDNQLAQKPVMPEAPTVKTGKSIVQDVADLYTKTAKVAQPDIATPTTPRPAQVVESVAPQKITTNQVKPATSDQIMADFTKAAQIKSSPEVDQPVAKPKALAPTEIDEVGNAVPLRSDQQLYQDTGVAPNQGGGASKVATEQMAKDFEQAAKQEFSAPTKDVEASPRLVEAINEALGEIKDDIMPNRPFSRKAKSYDVARQELDTRLKNTTPEMLVGKFASSNGTRNLSDPTDAFEAVSAMFILGEHKPKGWEDAATNAFASIAESRGNAGSMLRATQEIYNMLPAEYKVNVTLNKLAKKHNLKVSDITPQQREVLTGLVKQSDELSKSYEALFNAQREITSRMELTHQALTPEQKAISNEIGRNLKELENAIQINNGKVMNYLEAEIVPKGRLDLRASDFAKTMMLSSPSGRMFDIKATANVAAKDMLDKNLSALGGKLYNKFTNQPGKVLDTMTSPTQFWQGTKEGVGDIIGPRKVDNIHTAMNKASRSDFRAQQGPVKSTVGRATEAATDLTKGMDYDMRWSLAMQDGKRAGLSGDALKDYAIAKMSVLSPDQVYKANQFHMKANMLHHNRVSQLLRASAKVANVPVIGPILDHLTVPFKSFLGGSIHRAITEGNVLGNAVSAISSAKKHDVQGVIDNVARGLTNTAQMGLGYVMRNNGMIRFEDSQGNSYEGGYITNPDGTWSVPITNLGLNNAINLIVGAQVARAHESGEDPETVLPTIGETIAGVVASVPEAAKAIDVTQLTGDTTLGNTLSSISKLGGEGTSVDRTVDKMTDAGAGLASNLATQFIPNAGRDINAILDYTSLNPTHEAAETKATKINPEKGTEVSDGKATALNRLINAIPVASQTMLDRQEGVPAKTFGDRVEKRSRKSVEATQKRYQGMTDEQIKKDRETRGVPMTDKAIKVKMENGEYDLAMEGLTIGMMEADKNGVLSKSDEKKYNQEMDRLEVTRDGGYDPIIQEQYKGIGVELWRRMGDPDSEDYDPALHETLKRYDQELAAKDASRNSNFSNKPKYTYKETKGKGSKSGIKSISLGSIATVGSGSSGGASGAKKIAYQKVSDKKSSIPKVKMTKNYDTSKLRKISRTKGRIV